MSHQQIHGFRDELEKIAMGPGTAAGIIAGKVGLTNLLSRHATKLPPVRWLGREIAGVGARTGMQGKPMVSRVAREVGAATVDPKVVGLYENAHHIGKSLGPAGTRAAQQAAGVAKKIPHMPPAATDAAKFFEGVPLESKGVRKAIDYGFTPVSQVGRDIGSGAKSLAGRVFKRLPKAAPRRVR